LRTLFSDRFFDLAELPEIGHWRADNLYAPTYRLDAIDAKHLGNRETIALHAHTEGGHRLVKRTVSCPRFFLANPKGTNVVVRQI
jgi:hypothetical protein